ncbi:hypothetical protein PLICRDRAFT_96570 [Plicaturopsis crispa FD-325 SS-3]|nr:hypothetical protein PLICRDRAFT_96570 [Plicaturopsis crispa FD-325 SS-3]
MPAISSTHGLAQPSAVSDGTASRSSSPSRDYAKEIQDLVASLQPGREAVADELGVLQSIYGEDAIRLRHPSAPTHTSNHEGGSSGTIRYEANISLSDPHEAVPIKLLVSLPPSYPATSPPQLQLLSRYIGPFGSDANIFGDVLRTYISTNGVEWSPDTVCVFDGLQSVIERCTAWYEDHLSAEAAGELVREDEYEREHPPPKEPVYAQRPEQQFSPPPPMPEGVVITESEPITDRKSTFVGRACRISHPSQVPVILSHLMADRRVARAAIPLIHAWRCQVGPLLHQDNDDDGETAAGGRLAHLLQILEVNNVLVVVSRYFGGIHIGPDRFKHINSSARNALELGGFLDLPAEKHTGRGKKR